MKNLLIVLALSFCSTSIFYAQEVKVTDKPATSVKLSAKFLEVIAYLETKTYYKPGMSEEAFISATTSCIEEPELVDIFKPYMAEIYRFHTQKLTSDQVYDRVDGNQFARTASALKAYEIRTNHNASAKKPKWFNWLRKFIDFVDDHWN